MNRTELTLAIAGALVAAVMLGWILRWLFTGLNQGGRGRLRRTADLVERLHAAEEAQAKAEQRLGEVERELTAELAEARDELQRAQSRLEAARAEVDEIREAYRLALGPRSAPGP